MVLLGFEVSSCPFYTANATRRGTGTETVFTRIILSVVNNTMGGSLSIEDIKTELDKRYAPITHSHADYASATHVHQDYAPRAHVHADYAPLTHVHSDYAARTHNHAQYLPSNESRVSFSDKKLQHQNTDRCYGLNGDKLWNVSCGSAPTWSYDSSLNQLMTGDKCLVKGPGGDVLLQACVPGDGKQTFGFSSTGEVTYMGPPFDAVRKLIVSGGNMGADGQIHTWSSGGLVNLV